eukprot:COSAG01_NODE_4842_length_4691_cov_4.785061_3_plen_803_part_00
MPCARPARGSGRTRAAACRAGRGAASCFATHHTHQLAERVGRSSPAAAAIIPHAPTHCVAIMPNAGAGLSPPRVLSYAEVSQHDTPGDTWLVVGDRVYDVSAFASSHPGGVRFINKYAGKVATEEFVQNHPVDIIGMTLPGGGADNLVGTVELGSLPPEAFLPNAGFDDSAVPQSGDGSLMSREQLPPLDACVNLLDYEAVAMEFMPQLGLKKGMDYYCSGADDEETLRNNVDAFHRVWLTPRVLRDVGGDIDTSCQVLGNTLPFPVYLSAVAMQKLGHPDGELAWIRAAHNANILHMLPTMSSVSADDCFAECNALGQPFWYQLYVHPDRAICAEMVRKADHAGCEALFITVDTPTLGRRDRDRRNKVVAAGGAGPSQAGSGAIGTGSPKDASLSWKDISWFRSLTKMKIFLKGIGTAEDAILAFRAGVDGIVCSNHGGRQLNTARSGLEILCEVMPALRKECGGGDAAAAALQDFWVFMDGGVRRGTDLFKAVAMGARAVGLGKPATFAMSCYGQKGIEQMLGQLRDEFRNVCMLMGVTSLSQLRREGPSMLNASNLYSHLAPGPQDRYYRPVNVLTHGKLPPEIVGSNLSNSTTVTTTTTTSKTLPDGTVTTTSTTTTADYPAQITELTTTAAADSIEIELHDYHEQFLAQKAAQYGLTNDAVLRCLVNFAAQHQAEWEAIFRTVHCHRCDKGEGQQNKWKKSKKSVTLILHPAHKAFLADRVANIEGARIEVSGPVHRAVKDLDKAVRVIMDWAITQEHNGATHLPQIAKFDSREIFGTAINQIAALSKVSFEKLAKL